MTIDRSQRRLAEDSTIGHVLRIEIPYGIFYHRDRIDEEIIMKLRRNPIINLRQLPVEVENVIRPNELFYKMLTIAEGLSDVIDDEYRLYTNHNR